MRWGLGDIYTPPLTFGVIGSKASLDTSLFLRLFFTTVCKRKLYIIWKTKKMHASNGKGLDIPWKVLQGLCRWELEQVSPMDRKNGSIEGVDTFFSLLFFLERAPGEGAFGEIWQAQAFMGHLILDWHSLRVKSERSMGMRCLSPMPIGSDDTWSWFIGRVCVCGGGQPLGFCF